MDYYASVLKKYATFSGRATREEFWTWYVANLIINLVLAAPLLAPVLSLMIRGDMGIFSFIESYSSFSIPLLVLYNLFIILPSISVMVRRLHDTGRSGGWVFINFVPYIGGLILLILLTYGSYPGENKYGPNPRGVNNNSGPSHGIV